MDAATHLTWLRREGELLATLPTDGLDAPVVACPGWTVERLVGHVGRVHEWATAFLRSGPAGAPPEAGPRPPQGPAVLTWYADRLAALLDETSRHDPDEPSRSFTGPAPAGFWFRRQAHEVAIHRWDAQHALATREGADAASQDDPVGASLAAISRLVVPFEPAQAGDGIDEWLDVFVPRCLAADGVDVSPDLVGATLHLHATDPVGLGGLGEWNLKFTTEGAQVERGHAKGDAALRGTAAALMLRVWHRRGPAVEGFGDTDVAEAMLAVIHVR